MAAQIEIEDLLEALQTDGPRGVVQQYRHNLIPSRILLGLYEEHNSRDIQLFLALYPTVPSQLLQSLVEECDDPEILAAAATNPRCTHTLLIKMAREGSAAVRAALAANKLQSQKVTSELAYDNDQFVRAALAGNSSITKPYRFALATDPEPAVRLAISSTPKLEEELIHALSLDDSAVVRANLYGYGKVEENILLAWALSDDVEAQRLMLTRNNLSNEVMESLCLSPYPDVQQVAQEFHEPQPHELLARAESDSIDIRLQTAGRELLPPEIQHLLAADPQPEVRAALAANMEIDEEVALFIAASNDIEACSALARNPLIPDAVKVELCHHDADEVRLQMAYRNDLSDDLLDILINQRQDLNLIGHFAMRGISYPKTCEMIVEQLITHRRPSMRIFAAASENQNNTTVRKLIRDESPNVRLALCANPVLSDTALEELANDWNPDVARAAKKRLKQRPETGHETLEEEDSKGLVSRIVRFFTE